jgi:hypothetical protein
MMKDTGIEICGHRSPRPRLDLNGTDVRPRDPNVAPSERLSPAECARIWEAVKNAAEGSNVQSAPAIEVDAS